MKIGRNIPQLRFNGFHTEWEMKLLHELSIDGFSNGVFNDPKKVGKGYRIINVKDMYTSAPINIDSLSRVAIDQKEFSKSKVQNGDIFFTRSSLVKEGIAYSNINLVDTNDLTFDGHLIRMRPNKDKYSPIFLYYCFATKRARRQFIKRGKTTTMTTIGQEDISKVEIVIPALPEQQKIATFLTSVDAKIQQLTKKKALLEQYKKGVMQKLFKQEIRFKDEKGRDYPKWENRRLAEISEVNPKSGSLPAKFIYIDLESVDKGELRLQREVELNDAPSRAQRLLENGDILFQTVRPYQMNNLLFDRGTGYVASTGYAQIRTAENGKFLYYAMHTHAFVSRVLARCTGTSFPAINSNDLVQIRIGLPSRAEQAKIADFLGAIDDKVSFVNCQIEATLEFKKGLLQQMFV